VALANFRNFREAAHAVHLSQPALTRSIQALEREFEIRLFDRTPDGVEITQSGALLIERAQSIIAERDELLREVELAKGLERGKFTVSAGAYPAYELIPNALARMLVTRPRMRCQVINENWRHVAKRVLSREAEIGVADLRAFQPDEHLQISPLGSHPFVFYCRAGHPLGGHRALTLDQVFSYPYVGTRGPPEIARLLTDVPAAGGNIDPETGDFLPAIEVDSIDTARRVILSCDGIAVAPVSYIADGLRTGQLQIVDYQADWMMLSYSFLHRARRTLSPAVQLFVSLLRTLEISQAAREFSIRREFGLGPGPGDPSDDTGPPVSPQSPPEPA